MPQTLVQLPLQPRKPPVPQLAPHVRAALAAAQAKPPNPSQAPRPLAPHVQAAVAAAQAKLPNPPQAQRPLAPHVQAAFAHHPHPEAAGLRMGAQAAAIHPRHARPEARCLAPVRGAIQRSKVSSFASKAKTESGQVYGIFETGSDGTKKFKESDIDMKSCVYVGKASLGDDVGDRFYQHCTDPKESKQVWHVDQGNYYDPDDDMKWPYVPREFFDYDGVTRLDVAVLEQAFLQKAIAAGAKPLNKINALTKTKFKKYKENLSKSVAKEVGKGWEPTKAVT